jgi:hypothetical protein
VPGEGEEEGEGDGLLDVPGGVHQWVEMIRRSTKNISMRCFPSVCSPNLVHVSKGSKNSALRYISPSNALKEKYAHVVFEDRVSGALRVPPMISDQIQPSPEGL